jgi:hypothetical protein
MSCLGATLLIGMFSCLLGVIFVAAMGRAVSNPSLPAGPIPAPVPAVIPPTDVPPRVAGNPQPALAPERRPPEPVDIHAGTEAALRVPSGRILVATSEANLDKLMKTLTIKDSEGILELLANGEAFAVDNGTKCRVLTPGILTVEVRIIEGDQRGRSGFVPREFIQP